MQCWAFLRDFPSLKKTLLPQKLTARPSTHDGTRKQSFPFEMVPFWVRRVNLVGGFNPFETYARQIGSFPQKG